MKRFDEKTITVKFTEADRGFMSACSQLAEMVVDLYDFHCKVILLSFEHLNHSVSKIVNVHHLERTIFSPITDVELKILKLFQPTYEAKSKSYFIYAKYRWKII
ncbi:PAS domain-containing protein [Acinetobacter pittii]|uniref:PAS domain-containing protein n=1 Tax=Acinetobacter pittii TaxID=48296 RepID=UPI0019522C62|nr:PAS domain-containing protein [Acinetobacter pittii]QRQ11525.1 PAS domain-containing protein [Acinetobacter pittii]